MNNVIPFPIEEREPIDDMETMEAVIWESIEAGDMQSAGAVASFLYDLKFPLMVDLVEAVVNNDMSAAYNTAYTMVSEATIMAARAALKKGGKPWIE